MSEINGESLETDLLRGLNQRLKTAVAPNTTTLHSALIPLNFSKSLLLVNDIILYISFLICLFQSAVVYMKSIHDGMH